MFETTMVNQIQSFCVCVFVLLSLGKMMHRECLKLKLPWKTALHHCFPWSPSIFVAAINFRGCFLFPQGFAVHLFWGNKLKNSTSSHRIHGTGIFTYIWLILVANVGKCTIHGSYGVYKINKNNLKS